LISLTAQRWLSENMMMRNEKMIIYFHLSRFRELVFREEENNVMIKILIEYVTENYDLKYAKIV